ncbi:MAG: transcriptional regulator [Microcoleus sp. PH2017_29_MFU_D_A]|jgi:DNA-binding phage protein|uniref:helix-turn-helix domain-containing transcriptional regulator n=1 Tax=unclassified Microcoleus TaxID=2642155 RepID=UPI001DD8D2CB|nr:MULTISPECIES: transcriptional regulator [unclassified Microcoleus]MCC3467100.1 transcriptional regulator [Microcoleus sp. PH2017_06_SFM_O_A]TAE45589.1 MAG: transcriptional regulator [Oscillatoriales cyanobacterium]MCC3412219.1 transcriptional regulator [Microcoleus sp. PH2017_02_FOX_O_A]MCC3448233.1 transcriptional regulator [Microcoleus sp. PH2017_09_SFU_O_A]MCC3457233.1 transcriptional regulator [Microcoleus sp. PH2017_08_TRC_O_A]
MVKSVPYHPFLIEQLKDSVYAAGYLTLFLNEQEEGDLDVGIFPSALKEVFEALGEPNMSADDAKLHLEKLDGLLSQNGMATIYALANWLNTLGLKLSVAVAEDEREEKGSVSDVVLVEVAKV